MISAAMLDQTKKAIELFKQSIPMIVDILKSRGINSDSSHLEKLLDEAQQELFEVDEVAQEHTKTTQNRRPHETICNQCHLDETESCSFCDRGSVFESYNPTDKPIKDQ